MLQRMLQLCTSCYAALDINPREWLTYVLTRIPYYNRDYSLDLAELLARNCKATLKLQETTIEIQELLDIVGKSWNNEINFYNLSKNSGRVVLEYDCSKITTV